MELEMVPVKDLHIHPDNPRHGDIDKIVASINANGFYGAIVVQRSSNRILAGNHRYQAAVRCGMRTIPTIFADVDDIQAKKILLADNRTSDFATYDTNQLQNLLKTVLADGDLGGTGFSTADLDKLVADVIDEPNDKRKRNLEPFENAFWLIKAPISMQGKVTEKIADALRDFDTIEIVSANN